MAKIFKLDHHGDFYNQNELEATYYDKNEANQEFVTESELAVQAAASVLETPEVISNYDSLDILDCKVFHVGSWRFTANASYMVEQVPQGKFLGQFARHGDVVGDNGDWYYEDESTYFYEITDSVTGANKRIYRAGSREMPGLVAFVVTSTRIILLDVTSAIPEMWMEVQSSGDTLGFAPNNGTSQLFTSCDFAGSRLVVGTSGLGVWICDFAEDTAYNISAARPYSRRIDHIANRNSDVDLWEVVNGATLPSSNVTDVDALVYEFETNKNVFGVQIPTVGVVTTDGAYIIESNQSNVIVSANPSATNTYSYVTFANDNLLVATVTDLDTIRVFDTSNMDLLGTYFTNSGSTNTWPLSSDLNTIDYAYNDISTSSDNLVLTGNSKGLNLWRVGTDEDDIIQACITTTYNTGWIKGNTLGIWMADSEEGDIFGPSTIADRSGRSGLDMEVLGGLTRAPVTPGSDIVSYSAYTDQDYAATGVGFNAFGASGDFYIMGWISGTRDSSIQYFLGKTSDLGSQETSSALSITQRGNDATPDANKVVVQIGTGTGSATFDVMSNTVIQNTVWYQIIVQRKNGVIELYINGDFEDSRAGAPSLAASDHRLTLGRIGFATAAPTAQYSKSPQALWRVGTDTSFTQEEITSIYRDEKNMFVNTSQSLLPGPSTEVQSVSFDDERKTYVVSTQDGISTFQQLSRIDIDQGNGPVGVYNGIIVSSG